MKFFKIQKLVEELLLVPYLQVLLQRTSQRLHRQIGIRPVETLLLLYLLCFTHAKTSHFPLLLRRILNGSGQDVSLMKLLHVSYLDLAYKWERESSHIFVDHVLIEPMWSILWSSLKIQIYVYSFLQSMKFLSSSHINCDVVNF